MLSLSRIFSTRRTGQASVRIHASYFAGERPPRVPSS